MANESCEHLASMLQVCLQANVDLPNLGARQMQLEHDQFYEKLSFGCCCLLQTKDMHIPFLYTRLDEIASRFLELLDHPDTKVAQCCCVSGWYSSEASIRCVIHI